MFLGKGKDFFLVKDEFFLTQEQVEKIEEGWDRVDWDNLEEEYFSKVLDEKIYRAFMYNEFEPETPTTTEAAHHSDSVLTVEKLEGVLNEWEEVFGSVDTRPILIVLTSEMNGSCVRFPKFSELESDPLLAELRKDLDDTDPYQDTYMMGVKDFEALKKYFLPGSVFGMNIETLNVDETPWERLKW